MTLLACGGDDRVGHAPRDDSEPIDCGDAGRCQAPQSDFEPGVPPSFDPCGGDPTGVWVLSWLDYRGFVLDLQLDGREAGSCATDVSDEDLETPHQLLWLQDGGNMVAATSEFDVHFRVLSSCIRERIDPRLRCSDIDCTDERGACVCLAGSESGITKGTWRTSGSTLWLQAQSRLSAKYCVSGLEMVLLYPNGIRQVYAATRLVDGPLACDQRTDAQCELGRGCHLKGSLCSGSALPCALQDYGTVPGCELTEVEQSALLHRPIRAEQRARCWLRPHGRSDPSRA